MALEQQLFHSISPDHHGMLKDCQCNVLCTGRLTGLPAYLGILWIVGKCGGLVKVVAGEETQCGVEDAGEVVKQDCEQRDQHAAAKADVRDVGHSHSSRAA